MASLINQRWVDIPETDIFRNLTRVGLAIWGDQIVGGQHYLFGGDYAYPYSLPAGVVQRLAAQLNGATMFNWRGKVTELAALPRYNNATQYGVAIKPASPSKWVASVYHLTQDENQAGHSIYMEVLCRQGDRATYQPIAWGWEGMTAEEQNQIGAIYADKPDYEIKSHPIFAGQRIWLEIAGGDTVQNLHTMIDPDDPPGNTRFHHSYLVLFRELEDQPPPAEPPPDPGPVVTSALTGEIKVTVNQAWIAGMQADADGNVTFTVRVRDETA